MNSAKTPQHSQQHVLLLTGVPGVGKTTVIRRVAEHLGAKRLGGFYTQELRQHGQRRGFRLLGFKGEQHIIAHVDFPKHHRVGKYGVDVSAIDAAVDTALVPDSAVALYLVDEIGKMECLSQRFVSAVGLLLSGDTILVATVAIKGSGLIAEIKARQDSLLWEITRENRNVMPERVLAWLAKLDIEVNLSNRHKMVD